MEKEKYQYDCRIVNTLDLHVLNAKVPTACLLGCLLLKQYRTTLELRFLASPTGGLGAVVFMTVTIIHMNVFPNQ